jgi:hypothetical protein
MAKAKGRGQHPKPVEIPTPMLSATIRTRGEALDFLEECSALLWAVHDCQQFQIPLPELLLFDLVTAIERVGDFLRAPEPFELRPTPDCELRTPALKAAALRLSRLLVEAREIDDEEPMPRRPDGRAAYINEATIPALERLAAQLKAEAA